MKKAFSFADEIRAWRKAHNWLQKQAADFLGIPMDTYRSWECGRKEPYDTPSKTEIRAKITSASASPGALSAKCCGPRRCST